MDFVEDTPGELKKKNFLGNVRRYCLTNLRQTRRDSLKISEVNTGELRESTPRNISGKTFGGKLEEISGKFSGRILKKLKKEISMGMP